MSQAKYPVDFAEVFGPDKWAAAKTVAQVRLGCMYWEGDGFPKDHAQAAKCFRKAAEQGNAAAQAALGYIYDQGDGVPKDYAEAAKWCRKAAEQGNAVAQLRLGCMYFAGDGVPKDSAEAAKWLRKAAEQGHPGAQDLLGGMYTRGDGVPKDDAVAAEWFRKAAQQGSAEGQYHLGCMYFYGGGIPRDNLLAHAWLNLAGQTLEEARTFRDRLQLEMTPEQIAEAEKLSQELKPRQEKPKEQTGLFEEIRTGAGIPPHRTDAFLDHVMSLCCKGKKRQQLTDKEVGLCIWCIENCDGLSVQEKAERLKAVDPDGVKEYCEVMEYYWKTSPTWEDVRDYYLTDRGPPKPLREMEATTLGKCVLVLLSFVLGACAVVYGIWALWYVDTNHTHLIGVPDAPPWGITVLSAVFIAIMVQLVGVVWALVSFRIVKLFLSNTRVPNARKLKAQKSPKSE